MSERPIRTWAAGFQESELTGGAENSRAGQTFSSKSNRRFLGWIDIRWARFGALAVLALVSAASVGQQAAPGHDGKAGIGPEVASWFVQNSNRYARVVEQTGHSPVTTWPSPGLPNRSGGQSKPAYADIQQVSYSSEWVYIKGTGLASHQMGPWYLAVNRIFDNWPTNQSYIRRFPRTPKPAEKKVANGLGDLGTWVNGVALFNMMDGGHYDTASGYEQMGPPGGQTGAIWVRNAVPVEGPTFDKSNAHQPPMGTYHYHSNPLGLRYQLNDNVSYERANDSYKEDTSKLHHSPILGWAYDGYPIYGPYGYAEPTKPTSGIRRMVSGFVVRDGSHNTTDLAKTGRRSLAKRAAQLHTANQELAATQFGPDVSVRYPLGRYCEDYDYLGDLGYVQGKDFDLDRYNGRFCITPDYPKGTYAYFVTLNEDGSAAYPYVMGRQYYGIPSGGNVGSITETVSTYKTGGADTPIQMTATTLPDGGKQIAWTSVEGAHYKIEFRSGVGGAWSVAAADVKSQGQHTAEEIRGSAPAAKAKDFRILVASLEPYDNTPPSRRRPVGPGGGPGVFGGPGGRRGPGGGPRGFGGPGGPGGGFGGPGGPGDGFGGPDGPGGPGRPGGGDPIGTLTGIKPGKAAPGAAVSLMAKPGGIMAPPEFVQPSSVTIGTLTARKVTWDGETVTAEFLLPADAKLGAQDVKVVFPGPPGSGFSVTFTARAAFVVTKP